MSFHRYWPYVVGAMMLHLMLAPTVLAKKKDDDKKPDPELTLDRIYVDGEFQSKGYNASWSDNDDFYWRWKETDGQRNLIKVDAMSDEETIIVTGDQLVPAGETAAIRAENFSWTDAGDKLLLFTNSKRVWRYRTRGDYWVLDRSNRELRKLGGDAPPSSLMFAKFSPDGNSVAYVRDGQIYLESLLDNSIRAVTKGPRDTINGTFDWVYEEELSARDGFRWSSDGSQIAYWSLDTSGVSKFTMVNNTDRFYPRIIQFAYPKTGQTNSACRVFVYDVASQKHRRLPIKGDPRNHYLARLKWDGSEHVIVQQLNRLQNQNRVLRINTRTLNIEQLFVEQDEAWVNVHDEMLWLKDSRRFTWISERDGWRHLYLYSLDERSMSQVTSGEFDVIRLLRIDEQNQLAYFLASPKNATQRYLYRVNLDGSELTRVTPDKKSGSHDYDISPTAKLAIHRWSSFGKPPRTELIRLPDHEQVKKLEWNRELHKKLKRLHRGKHRFFRVAIDQNIQLDGWSILPPKMDRSKQYPVLVYVYGEPAGQTVLDRWQGSSYLWHLMLSQRGYIVLSVDNRGTPAPRGREWRKCVYRRVGDLAPHDQAAAIRQLLQQHSFMDERRIGVWGWSGGGSMTLNAMFKFPKLYHTGISIAPVPNQRHYDTIYQERYMGLPSENVDGYIQGSPIHFADQLEGNLLLVHGTGDDNCHYQTTEALINELIKHDKPFTMMAYPNRTHAIREGKGTTLHLRRLMTSYLFEHLPSGPKSPPKKNKD